MIVFSDPVSGQGYICGRGVGLRLKACQPSQGQGTSSQPHTEGSQNRPCSRMAAATRHTAPTLSSKRLNSSQRHSKVHKSVSPLLVSQVYGFKNSKETFATKDSSSGIKSQDGRQPFLQYKMPHCWSQDPNTSNPCLAGACAPTRLPCSRDSHVSVLIRITAPDK